MSLANVKAKAEKEEAQKNKIPDGKYQVRLKDWKFGQSQKGADMYTLTWKILKVIELENADDEEIEVKGKERKTRYLPKESWSIIDLLNIVEAAGADLEKYDKIEDIDDIMEAIEDTKMPKAVMDHRAKEGSKYADIIIEDVEKVLVSEGAAEDGEDEDEDEDEVATPPAEEPKARKKRAVKSPGK